MVWFTCRSRVGFGSMCLYDVLLYGSFRIIRHLVSCWLCVLYAGVLALVVRPGVCGVCELYGRGGALS
jgi:hypothetical protein